MLKISVVVVAIVVVVGVVTLDVHAVSVQNAKFGFGGKKLKRGVKRNTSASSADMSAFKPSLCTQPVFLCQEKENSDKEAREGKEG